MISPAVPRGFHNTYADGAPRGKETVLQTGKAIVQHVLQCVRIAEGSRAAMSHGYFCPLENAAAAPMISPGLRTETLTWLPLVEGFFAWTLPSSRMPIRLVSFIWSWTPRTVWSAPNRRRAPTADPRAAGGGGVLSCGRRAGAARRPTEQFRRGAATAGEGEAARRVALPNDLLLYRSCDP